MLTKIDNAIFFFLNNNLVNDFFDGLIKFFIQIPGEYAIILIGVVAFLREGNTSDSRH